MSKYNQTAKFLPPYVMINGKLKCTLRKATNEKSGVYLIKNRAGKIIYVGFSSNNIYRTLYRHFQNWTDPKQKRFLYAKEGFTVRIITTTPARAELLEKALILKLKPEDNKNKYESFTGGEQARIDRINEEYQAKKNDVNFVLNWDTGEFEQYKWSGEEPPF